VLERINDKAHKLELRADFGSVSPTFNIAYLKPYFGEKDGIASRTTSIQEGKHDGDIRYTYNNAYARTDHSSSCQQLNYRVLSFLGTIPHIRDNMMLPKLDVFVTLRND
jgi:hypothetical protein